MSIISSFYINIFQIRSTTIKLQKQIDHRVWKVRATYDFYHRVERPFCRWQTTAGLIAWLPLWEKKGVSTTVFTHVSDRLLRIHWSIRYLFQKSRSIALKILSPYFPKNPMFLNENFSILIITDCRAYEIAPTFKFLSSSHFWVTRYKSTKSPLPPSSLWKLLSFPKKTIN